MLSLAFAWPAAADEAAQLRKLGAGVFTTGGEVTEINLNRSKITNAQLRLVAAFPKLTDLSLEQTAITGKGLSHLTGLTKLEWVNLFQTQVGDDGLEVSCRRRNPAPLPARLR
ncbi:MAG: hypothetical protein CBC62_10750, partial [Opitutia bacterium TMED102]